MFKTKWIFDENLKKSNNIDNLYLKTTLQYLKIIYLKQINSTLSRILVPGKIEPHKTRLPR